MTLPQIELNDGHLIPQLGFGVFLVGPGETEHIGLFVPERGVSVDPTAGVSAG